MNKPKLNDKLINCVLEHIEREVKRKSNKYDQNNWGVVDWDLVDKAVESEDTSIDQRMCGSHGCFAGWACMLSMPLSQWRKVIDGEGTGSNFEWAEEGAKRLGLTPDERSFLFGGTNHKGGKAQLAVIKRRIRVIRESRESGKHIYHHPDFEECNL